MADTINFEILDDGTVSIETEGISGANHVSADELLKELEEVLGGTPKVKQKEKKSNAHIMNRKKMFHTH